MLKKVSQSGLSWLWVAFGLLFLDRYAKTWMIHHLEPWVRVKVLPFLNFTLAFNKGAAFSFLHSASGWQLHLLSAFAMLVSAGMLYGLSQSSIKAWWFNISLCCIIAGALGNTLDRLYYGYVIDFIDFHLKEWHFAIFNVADTVICIGAMMLFVHWMKEEKKIN